MNMSHLEKEGEELHKRRFDAYTALHKKTCRLIDYVSRNLPENAQEVLYSENGSMEGNDILPRTNLENEYALTRNGVIELRKMKSGAEKLDVSIKSAETMDFVTLKDDPSSFKVICRNLQHIIDKHKIKIPKEYL
jgi:hypothetical protein